MTNSLDMRDFLSQTKFYESYSRYIDDENRYESWDESVDRVMLIVPLSLVSTSIFFFVAQVLVSLYRHITLTSFHR